jgi:hypothetical protein
VGIVRLARPWLLAGFALLLASLLAPAASGAARESAGRGKPLHSDGVNNAVRLTDGMLSNEGDEWLTDVTRAFRRRTRSSSTTLASPGPCAA